MRVEPQIPCKQRPEMFIAKCAARRTRRQCSCSQTVRACTLDILTDKNNRVLLLACPTPACSDDRPAGGIAAQSRSHCQRRHPESVQVVCADARVREECKAYQGLAQALPSPPDAMPGSLRPLHVQGE